MEWKFRPFQCRIGDLEISCGVELSSRLTMTKDVEGGKIVIAVWDRHESDVGAACLTFNNSVLFDSGMNTETFWILAHLGREYLNYVEERRRFLINAPADCERKVI